MTRLSQKLAELKQFPAQAGTFGPVSSLHHTRLSAGAAVLFKLRWVSPQQSQSLAAVDLNDGYINGRRISNPIS